jgi:hypothetical protein
MARLIRAVPELSILIKGMLASMRSVATTLGLLLIVMYIFAIFFTQISAGYPIGEERFSTVGESIYQLWLYGVLCLDFAEEIAAGLSEASSLAFVAYYLFVLLGPYTIMNMLIGVLCEVVCAVASSEKEANLVVFATEQLRDSMKRADENGNEMLSKEDFLRVLEDDEACMVLDSLGIDVVLVYELIDGIFDKLEAVDPEIAKNGVTFRQAASMLLDLRGSCFATVKDMVELRKFLRCFREDVKEEFMETRNVSARSSSNGNTRRSSKKLA